MKQNNKNKQTQKPKIIATTYEKLFEIFDDMIAEFKNLHPVFTEAIFKYEDTDPKLASLDILDYAKEYIPDIVNGQNLRTQVSVSSNRVTCKTNKFFSFGWKFKYDKNGVITDLVAVITTLTRENLPVDEDLASMITALNDPETNWKEVEYNK